MDCGVIAKMEYNRDNDDEFPQIITSSDSTKHDGMEIANTQESNNVTV